jgi:hypothetical protein
MVVRHAAGCAFAKSVARLRLTFAFFFLRRIVAACAAKQAYFFLNRTSIKKLFDVLHNQINFGSQPAMY